ncbi:MAG: hypothetical protein L0Z70_13505 [Chloroflexi bacterium]|nr:hypothetical protein [Chloroflexota bacterium]
MSSPKYRFPLLLLAILSLSAALWAGWIRLGWPWPPLRPTFPATHGPLMVAGFLGTLIILERAVALRRAWMYAGALVSGLGGLLLLAGWGSILGPLLITLGSLGLVAILIVIIRQHTAPFTLIMGLGALTYLIGNLLWLFGWPLQRVVLWWVAFLLLTIAGERLELGRIIRLPRAAQRVFQALVATLLLSLIVFLFSHIWGMRLFGLAILAMALWLLRYDISRRTIRQAGLPRFAAVCLLSGYIWLAAAGLIGVYFGGVSAGPVYDAYLHTIFVGFVIAMIFGHAPIIFPSVLGLPISFTPWFYSHLTLLHLSLVLRLAGDLIPVVSLRSWGGLLNGMAILLFLAITIWAVLTNRKKT